jgi:hypothetical protein
MGGGQEAPKAYQPNNPGGADTGFQAGAGQLSSAGQALSSSVTPQLASIAGNVTNNPYLPQAMSGAQSAANVATSQVAPQQLSSAQDIANLSRMAGGAAPGVANTAMNYGQDTARTLNGYVPITSNPGLIAGLQTLQTGYDPQSALYNRSYQQNQDQTNAINAMYGVSGSPYGAGVAADSSRNFNIDWQNQQLARQIQALGAWNGAASTSAANVSNLAGGAQSAINSGINTGVNAFNTLSGDAGSLADTASNLGTAGLNTMATAAQLPYDLWLRQQQAGLTALGTQIQDTNAAHALTQQSVGDYGKYLDTGQSATQINQNAVQQDNQRADQQAAGIGNLFGTAAEMFLFA